MLSPRRSLSLLSLFALCRCAPIALIAPVAPVAPVSALQREVSFETQSVTVGDRAVASASVLAQGAQGAQQNWFFSRRPDARGPLRVRVAVRGARLIASDDDGLVFAAGEARVRYSHGLWVGRDGRSERVLSRFVDGAIELSVSEEALERTSFPAVLDPTVTLLNTTGVVEGPSAVDQAYPAMLDERAGFIAVGHFRSVMSAPEARGIAVDIAAASSSPGPIFMSSGHDAIGLTAIETPVRSFVGSYRQAVGAGTNLYVASYPPPAVIGSTGFAPMDLPEFDCARDGRCAASYARVDAPAGVVVRRYDIVSSGMTPGLGMSGVTFVTDPPVPGQHDIAMLGGRPVVVSGHRNASTLAMFVRVARLPEFQYTGSLMDRPIELEGERPRVACGPVDCAVVFVRGSNLFATRVTGAPLPASDTIEPLSMHAFNESVGSFDVTAIAGGYRVAYVRKTMGAMRPVMIISDHVGDFSASNARRTEHALPSAAEFVRLSSAPGSRVSILAWVNGAAPNSGAMGAVIRPDPVVSDASAEASVDASDASDGGDGSDGSAPDAASIDGSAADAASVPDVVLDARDDRPAIDALAQDSAVTIDPALRFTGGACACRAGGALAGGEGHGPTSTRAVRWLVAVALTLSFARRRAVSARS
ncbi:MAG: hypothetical protein U0269_16705 [Polyangiales bacterium]